MLKINNYYMKSKIDKNQHTSSTATFPITTESGVSITPGDAILVCYILHDLVTILFIPPLYQ